MVPQSALILILPVLTPMVGTSLAAVLSQEHWPTWLNDGLAWFCLLLIACADMWANNQLAGGWLLIVADAIQIITLLSSGWLVKLSPWLVWLAWLQANVFNLLPLFEQIGKVLPPPANSPVRGPSALTFPPPPNPAVPPRASAGPPE